MLGAVRFEFFFCLHLLSLTGDSEGCMHTRRQRSRTARLSGASQNWSCRGLYVPAGDYCRGKDKVQLGCFQ
jgi:hypothetical protein